MHFRYCASGSIVIYFPIVNRSLKCCRLPTVLGQEEVAQLIDAGPTPFYRILLMTLYATGARRAELARLQVSDIESRGLPTTIPAQ
jgi:site-specific recombinase XerD